jgi:SAM-dependent methyltransferase
MTDIDFSGVRQAYTWRIPYFPAFFEQIAVAAKLTDKSFVLDLACGTGELAVGISRYCSEVLGIDKTPEMLSARRELPANVRFLKADLNAEAVTVPRQASLVTIGRAIPYLDRSVVMPFLDSVVGERGAVVVCAAGISDDVPWLGQYRALCARYRSRSGPQDFRGERSLTTPAGKKRCAFRLRAGCVAAPKASIVTLYPIRPGGKAFSRTGSGLSEI